jgi:catechol 2,3-dioxygenase-like lactoylglutathione lyase family enzyme
MSKEDARVSSLGHVGIAVQDLEKMTDFYTRVLGLTRTDGGGPGARIVFLSAQPEQEHHEFVLGLAPPGKKSNAQQISFTVGSLDDLRELYHAIRDHPECSQIRVVSHGIAIGCYFLDPEQNRIEVYWPTGMDYVQPVADPVDLDQSNDEIMRALRAMPPRPSATPRYYGEDVGKRLPVGAGSQS